MKELIRLSFLLTIVALWAGSTVPLSAQTVIFNNSSNSLQSTFYPGTTQVGNEILLAPGTPRFLTTFSFEYYGTNTASSTSFAGPVTAEVRFYENNGAPSASGALSPGTMFYDETFTFASVGATPGQHTLVFSGAADGLGGGGLLIPTDDMTWTVQFTGMGATDSVGVDLYYPATVGQTYGDYWVYEGNSWLLETNSLVPQSSFGAYLSATVPEPSTLSLSLLGGLGILALTRLLRRKD
ncbi:MAG: PEP-CTERM sorting domain-containing protein [Limisphaerales bacterium]